MRQVIDGVNVTRFRLAILRSWPHQGSVFYRRGRNPDGPSDDHRRSSRNVGLDVVRFIALVLVFGRHGWITQDSATWMQAWARGGWVGVDLFFVLSGFLVSGLLFDRHERTGRVDARRFLIRRAFKIYPPFWVFLSFTLTLRWLLQEPPRWDSVLVELCFVQNYFAGIWIHTWSLAVEEHFYFSLAFLVVGLAARKRLRSAWGIPFVFAIVAVSCWSMRAAAGPRSDTFDAAALMYRTHLRIDSLFFGVLLAYAVRFTRLRIVTDRFPAWLLIAVGAAMLSPAFAWPVETNRWMHVSGFTLFYLGAGCILLAAVRLQSTQSAIVQSMATAGVASYSIYLWHVPVNQVALNWFVESRDQPALYWACYLAGSIIVGRMMHRLIERPSIALRDRLTR